MRLRENLWIACACVATLSLLIDCDTAVSGPPLKVFGIGQGPPPHAPAHGYRCKQGFGYELVFDTGIGLYVVVGMTDRWYHDGYFYRVRGGLWEISLGGLIWTPAGMDRLPPGLHVKARSMIKLNGNGNSLVKLNGNGNSLVKLNGNTNHPNGNAHSNANGPGGNAESRKLDSKPSGNTNKPAGNLRGTATPKPTPKGKRK